MTDEGECESSVVHSVTMSLSAFVTSFNSDLQMIIFLLHFCFSSLPDDLQQKLERVHSLIFFNILVVVVLYLELFVYTKFVPAQLN